MPVRNDTLKIKNPFEDLLQLHFGGDVTDLIPTTLLRPVKDLLGRPGKNIRGELVRLGYDMVRPLELDEKEHEKELKVLSECIEYLHAGSLTIDDIQDGSKLRRGKPTIHLKYGLPTALNTGNWLYFWPLERIRSLNLPREKELAIYRVYHRTVVRAHMGQALDVGLSIHTIEQNRVSDICLATMELKSGALFSLAILMGAILAGASTRYQQILDQFGHGFGLGLQMYDDIGNIKGQVDPVKRWEDLILRRPTWVWAVAAQEYPDDYYDHFKKAVQDLPHDRRIQKWIETHDFFVIAQQKADAHMDNCFSQFEATLPSKKMFRDSVIKLRKLSKRISEAYG